MKTLILAAVAFTMSPAAPPAPMSDRPQLVATCFKTGERSSGMNKICYYDCLGSEAAITVGVTDLCPLSINN